MNKLLTFFASLSFYLAILSYLLTLVNTLLKNKSRKWMYLSIIISGVALLANKYEGYENSKTNNIKIDSLNTRLSFIKDSNFVLKKQYDSTIKLYSLALDTTKSKTIEFENKLTNSEIVRLETEQKLKQELLQTNKSLSDAKQKAAPRSFTNEQKQKFISFLTNKPKGKISITAVMGDGEAMDFAEQIKYLLKEIGYITTGVDQVLFTDLPKGIILSVKSAPKPSEYTIFVLNAFQQIGMSVIGEIDQKKEGNFLDILVGHKND